VHVFKSSQEPPPGKRINELAEDGWLEDLPGQTGIVQFPGDLLTIVEGFFANFANQDNAVG
jgi:hypothetical protein